MNPFLKDTLRGVEGHARDAAQKALWGFLLIGMVGLTGLAGLGFLTASAFLALDAFVGVAWAALLTGLLLLSVAGGCAAIINRRRSEKDIADAPKTPPTASGMDPSDIAPAIAFTVAYVIGRHLGGDKPD